MFSFLLDKYVVVVFILLPFQLTHILETFFYIILVSDTYYRMALRVSASRFVCFVVLFSFCFYVCLYMISGLFISLCLWCLRTFLEKDLTKRTHLLDELSGKERRNVCIRLGTTIIT